MPKIFCRFCHRGPRSAPRAGWLASLILFLLLVPATSGRGVAEEGMWMPQQVGSLARELATKGFALDPEKLGDLLGDPMGAIVSLGGCSASFVSPQGLIATNHHCVYQSVQFNSTATRDLLTQGFLAKDRADELPTAPGTYVYVTSAIRDVTQEVLAGQNAGAVDDQAYKKKIERRRRELLDACEKPGGVRCVLGTFFEGTQFLLITQVEIQDVRLVYAPAQGIGNYGGEVDNWTWPRHTGDFAFLRAYVAPDGQAATPAPTNVAYQPKHWLKVATQPIADQDFVWIAGYPGRTFRYQTASEVRQAREFSMPRSIEVATALNTLLEQENLRGKEVELSNYARIRGHANRLKKFAGVLETMKVTRVPGRDAVLPDPVEEHRRAREAALALGAGQDATLVAAVAALAEMETWQARKVADQDREMLWDWLERSSPMLSQAYRIYRLSLEKTKEDLDRADTYRERDWSRFDQAVARAQRSIELGSDRVGLRYWLTQSTQLPAAHRIAAVDAALAATGEKEPAAQIEKLLDQLYGKTQIHLLPERQAMCKENTEQLDGRGDAFLLFVKALLPEILAREAENERYEGAMLRLRPRYLEGLKALQGGRLYPDANGTLRVTFGKVVGYQPRDGVQHLAHTTLPGLIAKASGERPFDAPANLLAAAAAPIAKAYLSPTHGQVPVNFLATCDITGGNSGSAVLNARGELVGLAFDGNWEGVVSDYLFLEDRARTIAVDALFLRFVMDHVDQAHHLLREMGLPVFAQP